MSGHGACLVVNSRQSDLRQRRPDNQKYWADDVIVTGDVDWFLWCVSGYQLYDHVVPRITVIVIIIVIIIMITTQADDSHGT